MNNYQDEEAGFIKNQYSERVVAWGKFLVFLLLGVIILIVSFPFSSILLINPAPFIMLFSAGSLMILIAILQIAEIGIIIKHTGSLAGTIVYLITLGLGIYAGVFHIGYFNTISVMCIQVSMT